jgi:hypothetical protein
MKVKKEGRRTAKYASSAPGTTESDMGLKGADLVVAIEKVEGSEPAKKRS